MFHSKSRAFSYVHSSFHQISRFPPIPPNKFNCLNQDLQDFRIDRIEKIYAYDIDLKSISSKNIIAACDYHLETESRSGDSGSIAFIAHHLFCLNYLMAFVHFQTRVVGCPFFGLVFRQMSFRSH
jgi:hypothetical protein